MPLGTGAMAAILGLDDDQVRAACNEAAQGEVAEAVNFNAPSQVVVAGHKAAVERAAAEAKSRGLGVVIVVVDGPSGSTRCVRRREHLPVRLRRSTVAA